MKITWRIEPEDVAAVREFFEHHRESPFVRMRIRVNLAENKPPISKDLFWERMVGCLLTTQQRSDPNSPVSRFLTRPFPLDYQTSLKQPDLAEFTRLTMSRFGGLRRSNIIGKELAANLSLLEDGGWEITFQHLNALRAEATPAAERRVAAFIDDTFNGFGPKQSRNLLQALGLSRFEIPIDSRITRWLNAFGFPVKLTANALQDRHYYEFVSEGFQRLSEACEIVPCVLDAAIFASYDRDGWTEENAVW